MKIKEAVETLCSYYELGDEMQNEALDTAIRSLQGWDELVGDIREYKSLLYPYEGLGDAGADDAYDEVLVTVNELIDVIENVG